MQLKNNNLILRTLEKEDLDLIYKWINDPEIRPFWYGKDKFKSKEWVEKHFEKILKRESDCICYIIEVKDKPIGMLYETIFENDDREFSGRVEVDILIGENGYREKGYGTEALKMIIDYAFEKQNAERIFLTPRSINPRAIHVYEKVGFKKEGILRHFEFFEGKWTDAVMMAIIRRDWEKSKKQ